ncbi:MAG: hypothetical protein DYG88_00190 [Chloroflexi bacterium CFX4]|nr:hypothetical protein [Chloroflexi bacterium CFX4]MDL1921682.1 hypothetical protein [Chloroflexi bacterium CFX3]
MSEVERNLPTSTDSNEDADSPRMETSSERRAAEVDSAENLTESARAPEVPAELSEAWLAPDVFAVPTDVALEDEAEKPKKRSWWQAARANNLTERILALELAISAAPDNPINYVLRGEALLDYGDQVAAAEDFQRGLHLISAAGETDWGYIHSILAERALEGLRRCTQSV